MRATLKTLARCKSLAGAAFGAAFGLALALLPLCASARAQTQAAPTAQPAPARRGDAAGRPARAAGLIRSLNLTREQRRQLRQIRTQGEPETRELARRVRLARRALDEAIYSDAADEALVDQRARELAGAQAALVRLRAATELKVRRVLTPEQLRAFRDLRVEAQRRQRLQRRTRGAGRQPRPGELPPDADDPADPPL